MSGNLRQSLWPLYIISRFLCIQTFDLQSLSTSFCGVFYSLALCIGYILIQGITPPPTTLGNDNERHLMAVFIDYFNRYAMFGGVLFIAFASICMQKQMIMAIELLEEIDRIFEQRFCVKVNSSKRCRCILFLYLLEYFI